MDFDFSDRDRSLWQDLTRVFDGRGDGVPVETTARGVLLDLLPELSGTGYLDAALTDDTAATVNLTAAMEKAAGFLPDHFLMLETSTRVFGRLLRRWGLDPTPLELLDRIRKGRMLGGVAFCEGAQNTGPAEIRTLGTVVGDRVRITGVKHPVLNAAAADVLAVVGRLSEALAVFLVPRDAPGLTVGPAASTLGGEDVCLGSIILDNCDIPSSHVVDLGADPRCLETLRLWENQVLCAAALADAGRAFDAAKDFAGRHHSGGKPIIAHQAVAFKLAEMYTLRQTAQLLAYHAGWAADAADRNAFTLMYCAKVFCSEAAERITAEALQVVGVHGCRPDGVLARAMGRSKFASLYGTSSEVARNTIGDAMMKYVD